MIRMQKLDVGWIGRDWVVRLPIKVLLSLPSAWTPTRWFNLLSQLLSPGNRPQVANTTIEFLLWAPHFSNEQIVKSVPGISLNQVQAMRSDFLHLTGVQHTGEIAVVHMAYPDLRLEPDGDCLWRFETGGIEQHMRAGLLRDLTIVQKVRLLILEASLSTAEQSFAETIVRAGGPPVLLLNANQGKPLQSYLNNLYRNLLHNWLLDRIVATDDGAVDGLLVYSSDHLDAFRYERYMDELQNRIVKLTSGAQKQRHLVSESINQLRQYLHLDRRADIETHIQKASEPIPASKGMEEWMERLKNLREKYWTQELDGAVPLLRLAGDIPNLEQAVSEQTAAQRRQLSDIDRHINFEATQAPRVVNANFAEPAKSVDERGRLIGATESLAAGLSYDLLVDIGPRWQSIESIVQGNSSFPEKALPPDQTGYDVQVLVVSDDFEPRVQAAMMWIPARTGRSYPIIDGTRAKNSGPVKLRLTAPKELPQDQKAFRLRFCLYYLNNLLQSGTLKVSVAPSPGMTAAEPNVLFLDYALNCSLQNLGRLGTRQLQLSAGQESAPVAINITMNDDGGSGHRLLLKGRDDQTPAVVSYDPLATDSLDDARKQLVYCFGSRNDQGEVELDSSGNIITGLSAKNEKPFDQFNRDLFFLAIAGKRLLTQMKFGAAPEDGEGVAIWYRGLAAKLTKSAVIQVARTVPSQYVFPWSLIYDIPITNNFDNIKKCEILKEWTNGTRQDKSIGTQCPYADEPWHQADVLCPYGFWGLKHIIEQPISLLRHESGENGKFVIRDAVSQVSFKTDQQLAVAVTRDAKLPRDKIEAHLGSIQSIFGAYSGAAEHLDDVKKIMPDCFGIYFLCHGKNDPIKREPFLGIGLDDNLGSHRIYPDTIADWMDYPTPGATLAPWEVSRPFVFLNGCNTSGLRPGDVLNFVSAFDYARASGVLGTEISVQLPVAAEFAEMMLCRIKGGIPFGQALREARWELANKGNLIGLAYTLYSLADLALTPQNAAAAPRATAMMAV